MTVLDERTGVATVRGRPVTLLGPEVRKGDTAPAFTALAADMSPVTLESLQGKVKLLSSVPSLDTAVCDLETRRFSEEASKVDGLAVLTISVDLPFTQARWCGAADIKNIVVASDHRDLSFGNAYGVTIKELRLLSRAVFVLDSDNTVVYAQYVPEMGSHPNYDEVLDAIRANL